MSNIHENNEIKIRNTWYKYSKKYEMLGIFSYASVKN